MSKNILLVEDNEANCRLLAEAFKIADCPDKLHRVENGNEAMLFLDQCRPFDQAPVPDLIVLDLNLPGKSGIEILAEIKSNSKIKNIPVAILTGSNSSQDIAACSKFQCRYLLKPSRFHEFVGLVETLSDLY